MTTRKFLVRQAVAVAGLILLLELVARIGHTVRSDVQNTWGTWSRDLGWDRPANLKGPDYCGRQRDYDAAGFLVADSIQVAAAARPRLTALFIGDSNTYGHCLETGDTFVEQVERLVPNTGMINLALSGYSSLQGYKTLLKYGDVVSPQLVFASFNYNDRRLVVSAEEADSDATFERMHRSQVLRHVFEASYAVRMLMSLLNKFTSSRFELGHARPRVSLVDYKRNLSRIADWGKARGIPVAFILLGDNPTVEASVLREGMSQLDNQDYAAAAKSFELAARRPSSQFTILAQLYQARAAALLGDAAKSRELLAMGVERRAIGGQPMAPDTDYHDAMRAVARERGVALVDAATALNKHPRVFFDMCHFDAEGHEIVARKVARHIEGFLASKQSELSGFDR